MAEKAMEFNPVGVSFVYKFIRDIGMPALLLVGVLYVAYESIFPTYTKMVELRVQEMLAESERNRKFLGEIAKARDEVTAGGLKAMGDSLLRMEQLVLTLKVDHASGKPSR